MKKLSKERKIFLVKNQYKIENDFKKRKCRKRKIKESNSTPYIQPKHHSEKHEPAPNNFSLKDKYVEEFLGFIKKLKRYNFKKNKYLIILHLENVIYIDEGAISMLLSVTSELSRNNVLIKGNKPNDPVARNVLERSGFFDHMYGYVSEKNKKSKNKILKTGENNTSHTVIIPEIHKSMETIWGVEARCPALYSGLGEMMRNTCDHAFNKQSMIKWHFGLCHDDKANLVEFSFVDNGKGIIGTYKSKNLLKKLSTYFSNNADILREAYNDGIESITGLPWRGKGLPTIFEMYTDKIIKKLIVITNNVYLDFDNKIYKILKNDFDGTYYYWKIDRTCVPQYFV